MSINSKQKGKRGELYVVNKFKDNGFKCNRTAQFKGNTGRADVDGSYGSNDNGIFFFTPDGKYIEWTGTYLYSDIPFEVKDTVVTYKEVQ